MKVLFCAVATIAALAVGSVSAGEISKSSLSQMGLGGLQVMSDSEGSQVRGMGIAIVFGLGTAKIGTSQSTTGYLGLFNSAAKGTLYSRIIVSGTMSTASGSSSISGH